MSEGGGLGTVGLIGISYRITLDDGKEKFFKVTLDDRGLQSGDSQPRQLPEWVRLDSNQCPNCPLSLEEHPHCPLALRLLPLVESMGGLRSYQPIHLEMTTAERVVSADTTVQEGISSLMGLFIATSGCPHTDVFKPMARFHLPLASPEETFYRVASMYALAQLLRIRKGLLGRSDFSELLERYRAMGTVNKFVIKRLRTANKEDGALNAIVLLDVFTELVPGSMEDSLQDLEALFGTFLGK